MTTRTGQHQTINQSHCEADLNSLPQRAQHATGLRAMNEHLVTEARVTGGNHEWLAINREANMADETFVENLIDQFAVVAAAIWKTLQSRARSLGKFVHLVLGLVEPGLRIIHAAATNKL